ncbi:MAG TPA: propionate--CoA ligase [Chthoniobacterales bacterium]|jgi:propionyl-CoA synthetase|nr:propionate--CoA ligase [Chthoniobacterales bacterium]
MSKPTGSIEFCRRALEQREAFWAEQAEAIHWEKPFQKVCDFSRPPFAKWFVGGETNLCYNAIDRHLALRAKQSALHYISTEIDAAQSFTYQELYDEVCRFAAVLKSLGLKRGDRVIIYLPMIPEAVFAMLACVRLGLVHSVVFAGFAPASLATRIADAEARLVITADAGLRGGKVIPLKRMVDEAISIAKFQPEHVLVCNRRIEEGMRLNAARDIDYTEARDQHLREEVGPTWLESGDPSYLLYTSGTTATPKGIQRDTGGHAVALAASMRYVFAGEPGQTIFTAADIGWAVGHSYGVYGPLIHGMQSVLYEGLPTRPDGGIWWRIVEKYGVSVMFTSPTAIRVLKRQDPEYLRKYDTRSLQRLYLAGEPLDEPTLAWIGGALEIPILDNYWQTETGWPVLALLPGIEPPQIRPGSPGIALYGYDAKIVDPATGETLPRGENGVLAIGLPLPPGCMPTVWKNDELFERHYCGRFPGKQLYSTFDYATQDEDGYFFILGRSDDVINVSGHRLGTREIEETVSSHPAVAEVATVGASDEIKGQCVHCFIVLKKPGDFSSSEAEATLKREIGSTVAQNLGTFARPAAIYVVRALPKTRSGKILRRAILAAAEGRDTGDLSTLEDPVALDAIKELLEVTRKPS